MIDLNDLLISCGALLRGHFLLTSGRHSDTYFEKFRILERPEILSALCAELAGRLLPCFDGVDPSLRFVAGPATGGLIIAFEMARQMGVQAVYVENEQGRKALRRGKTLPAGAVVVVVDDVLTTGVSLREVVEVLTQAGATVPAIGVLIDRSEAPPGFGVPCFASLAVDAKSYAPDEVPDWLSAIPIAKPGTRTAPPKTG